MKLSLDKNQHGQPKFKKFVRSGIGVVSGLIRKKMKKIPQNVLWASTKNHAVLEAGFWSGIAVVSGPTRKKMGKHERMSCEPRQKIRWFGMFFGHFPDFLKNVRSGIAEVSALFWKNNKNVLKMSCEPRQEILWSLIANSDLELLWYLNRPVFKRKNAWKCPVSLELRTIEKTISDQENAFTGGPFWSTAAQNLPEWPDPNFCVPRKGGTMEEQLRNHRSAQKCSRSDVFWSGCEYRTLA